MTSIIIVGSDLADLSKLYARLKDHVIIEKVIVEKPISRFILVKNRIKRLGVLKVYGQILFSLFIHPFLELIFRKHKAELWRRYFNNIEVPKLENIVSVESVNGKDAKELLLGEGFDCIVVYGTRIIKSTILKNLKCPVINIHVGITPKYRGVHGGYWALVNDDIGNFGVTVHLIDDGVDTGGILVQSCEIAISEYDSFVTYPILQFQKGMDILIDVLSNGLYISGSTIQENSEMESRLYYHPTIYQYVANLLRGVK